MSYPPDTLRNARIALSTWVPNTHSQNCRCSRLSRCQKYFQGSLQVQAPVLKFSFAKILSPLFSRRPRIPWQLWHLRAQGGGDVRGLAQKAGEAAAQRRPVWDLSEIFSASNEKFRSGPLHFQFRFFESEAVSPAERSGVAAQIGSGVVWSDSGFRGCW